MPFLTIKQTLKPAMGVFVFAMFVMSAGARAEGDAEIGRLLGYTCMGCHGIKGYRNAYPSYHVPKLRGQNVEYVKTSLRAYRDGKRDHPTMTAQGGSLTDADIDNLSAWIGRAEPAKDSATEDSIAAVLEAATCTQCHSANPTAATPDTPILAGQHEDYLVEALRQYRDGSRTGSVMPAFAAALSEDDIEAVAEFYASQDGLATLDEDD